MNNFKM